MTYEVKTPLALSCSYFLGADKKFWGFNAELITLWQEVLPAEAFDRLKVFDHQCLEIDKVKSESSDDQDFNDFVFVGLKEIFFQDLKKVESEFDILLVSAWLKIEPDRLLQITA